MRTLEQYLAARHGVAHASTLLAAGFRRSELRHAVDSGTLLRVRTGIYAVPAADADVIRAARVGGRLAGPSAARIHGLWTPTDRQLFVEVSGSASGLRDPDDAQTPFGPRSRARVLWSVERRSLAESLGVSSVTNTLRQCMTVQSTAHAIATIGSAVRARPVDRIEWEEFRAQLTASQRAIVDRADARSESGTESILRIALEDGGLAPQLQVPIPFTDLDRLDMLVGDRLVIECDSEAHHGGSGQRLKDLRRDTSLACLGFIVLRFDYWQIMNDLDSVVAAVLRYTGERLHLSHRLTCCRNG